NSSAQNERFDRPTEQPDDLLDPLRRGFGQPAAMRAAALTPKARRMRPGTGTDDGDVGMRTAGGAALDLRRQTEERRRRGCGCVAEQVALELRREESGARRKRRYRG